MIMKVSTYDQLIEQVDQPYRALIDQMGLSVHPTSRIFQALELVKKLNGVYKDKVLLREFLQKYDVKDAVNFAIVDLAAIANILPHLDPKDPIATQKLKLVSDGSLNPMDETSANNIARNTQFELTMYADLKRVGMDARLCEPNPDIEVVCGDRTYGVECKRVFAQEKLNKNFKDAAKQLKTLLSTKPSSYYGLVAVSVTRPITPPDIRLESPDQRQAHDFVAETMQEFVNANAKIWMNPKRLPGRRVPAVIVHYDTILYTQNDPPLNALTHRTITNTDDSSSLSQVENDFAPFLSLDSFNVDGDSEK